MSLGSVNDFALNTSANGTVLYRVNSTHLSVGGPDPDDVETVSVPVDSSMCVLLCTYVCTYICRLVHSRLYVFVQCSIGCMLCSKYIYRCESVM